MRPSAVSRSPLFAWIAEFLLRRISTAFSMSPVASVSAALQSIIGAPVFCRNFMTDSAEILLISKLPFVRMCPTSAWHRAHRAHRAHRWLAVLSVCSVGYYLLNWRRQALLGSLVRWPAHFQTAASAV